MQMSDLTSRERELVALGAALGSNCIPCIEYHIPQARKAGLSDAEIHAAIEQADKVRQVPARKVLETAVKLLSPGAGQPSDASPADGCGCGSAGTAAQTAGAGQTMAGMPAMMSKMMASCAPPRSPNV
jgi:4-carboxymuconolactone decarboxylase